MFFFPVGMHISAKYNPKLVIAVSGLITFSSFWASSYTLKPQVFIYCYGLGFGMSKGMLYSTALQSAISHFPERKGMVAGLVICGFGFGGLSWGLLA
jgi:MFS transporter, OFA family, oxalate/formate antiporter